MVFQSYALYPHMTVRENLGFGLRMRGRRPGRRSQQRVEQAASASWRWKRCSTGSRPALRRPAPASGAGPGDRAGAEGISVRRAALQPRRQAPGRDPRRAGAPAPPPAATIVYVTHDQEEAMTLGEPGRGDARRLLAAGGAADGAVSEAGQSVRRRVRRLARDELPAARRRLPLRYRPEE